MARKPRVHVAGGLYHLILRGNNRQVIFVDDSSRFRFLDLLSEGVPRFGYKVHAFCLMSNHVHLAVQAGDEPISKAMQNVGFRHARRTHWNAGSSGHVFQGRFKAILVEDLAYALELVRYIHLNPVKAGLVARPEDWRWSSHGAYLGSRSWSFLTTSWILEMLADDPILARSRYLELLLSESSSPERGSSKASRALNLEEVVNVVCGAMGTTPGSVVARNLSRLEAEVRSVILFVAVRLGVASVNDVAHRFGREPSGLSHGLHRLRARMVSSPEIALRVEALIDRLGSGT